MAQRNEAAAQAAAKDTGINLTTQDANSDTSKMIQYIESSVTAGEDAIIINMVDPRPLHSVSRPQAMFRSYS